MQKSLVRQVADDRFDLLASVQEYASEHLRTAARYPGSGPEALLAAEMRHGGYFAGWTRRRPSPMPAPSSTISSLRVAALLREATPMWPCERWKVLAQGFCCAGHSRSRSNSRRS
jgi:hypothetical protein